MSAQQQINNSMCLYGYSGSGKTQETGAVANYIWDKYRKRTRYITTDTGGWQTIQPYIDAGMIDAVNIAGHPDFLLILRGLAEGMWIRDGKLVKDSSLEDVGLIVVESITSICGEIMNYYRDKRLRFAEQLVAVQQLTSEDKELAQLMGTQTVSAVSLSHYNGLRDELFDRIRDFQRLLALPNGGPNLLLFTSHESSGKETVAGNSRTQLGIGALGQQITPALPQRFGDLFHLDTTTTAKGELEYRAYFQPHQDPELKREWPARLRVDAVVNKAILEHPEFKQGYLKLTNEADPSNRQGITKVLRFRDEVVSKAAEAIRARMKQK